MAKKIEDSNLSL